MKLKTPNLRHGLLLVIFLFSLFGSGQSAQAEITLTKIWQVPTQEINRAVFSSNDSLIFTTGSNGLWIYDKNSGEKVKELNYYFFLFTKNQDEFIAPKFDNSNNFIIDRIKISDWSIVKSVVFHTDENIGAAELKNGSVPLFINAEETVITLVCTYGLYIYEIETGNLIKKISLKDKPWFPVITKDFKYLFYEISGDGKKAFGYLMRMDLESEKQSLIETNGTQSVLSPDGKYLVYKMAWATQPYSTRIIDPNTLQEIWQSSIYNLDNHFSADSKFLVSSINTLPTDHNKIIFFDLRKLQIIDSTIILSHRSMNISNKIEFIVYDWGYFQCDLINGFNGIISSEFKNLELIYPNPAEDYIIVGVNGRSPLREDSVSEVIRIFNIFGNEMHPPRQTSSDTPQEGNLRIDVSTLSAGVYFVRIGNEKPLKFVKI